MSQLLSPKNDKSVPLTTRLKDVVNMMRVNKHIYTYGNLRHCKTRTVIRGNPPVMHTEF